MLIPGSDSAPEPGEATASARTAGRQEVDAVRDVCPYLRADAGPWRSAAASRAHQCSAMEPAAQVSVAKQRALCLAPAHTTCATFLAARKAAGTLPEAPADDSANLWPDTRAMPIVLEPARSLLGPLAGGTSRTGGQALLVALMIVAFVVLVVARASGPGSPGAAGSGASESPTGTPASSDAATPSSLATPSSAPSLVPSVAPSSAPSTAPSAAPTPSPSVIASQTYTVKSGDTLSGIAAKFGTTVAALSAANNIADPRYIRVGQVLVIP